MPTESKSETPRTDKEFDIVTMLMQASGRVKGYPLFKKYIDGTPLENDAAVWIADFCLVKADFARQLEKELNEANDKLAEAQQWLDSEPDWKDKFFANYYTLAKENKVMRVALEEIAARTTAGKVLSAADCCVLARNVLDVDALDTTNLIVLTRDELITEIEKMPHSMIVTEGKNDPVKHDPNCCKCQWLARVKGSAVPG